MDSLERRQRLFMSPTERHEDESTRDLRSTPFIPERSNEEEFSGKVVNLPKRTLQGPHDAFRYPHHTGY